MRLYQNKFLFILSLFLTCVVNAKNFDDAFTQIQIDLGLQAGTVSKYTRLTNEERTYLQQLVSTRTLAVTIHQSKDFAELTINSNEPLNAASVAKLIAIPSLYELAASEKILIDEEKKSVMRRAIFESHNESACKTFQYITLATQNSCYANNLMAREGIAAIVGYPYGSCTASCANSTPLPKPTHNLPITSQHGTASGFQNFWRLYGNNSHMLEIFKNFPNNQQSGWPKSLYNLKLHPDLMARKGGSLASFNLNLITVNDSGFMILNGTHYYITLMLSDRLLQFALRTPSVNQTVKNKITNSIPLSDEEMNYVRDATLLDMRDIVTKIFETIIFHQTRA